jgi:hypothetical protein
MMKKELALIIFSGLIPFYLFAQYTIENEAVIERPSQHDKSGIFYFAHAKNLLLNSDFENGTSYWTLGKYNGGIATLYTDSVNNSFSGKQAVVQAGGSFNREYEDIQLFSFMEISKNTIYTISFQASVKTACLISISLSNGVDTFFDEELLLRPEQTIYGPFSFKSNTDEAFSFFAFNLGRTNATMVFDDVTITADDTEKQFEQIVSNAGINIHQVSQGKELYIQLPTAAKADYPVIFINEKGKTLRTAKIHEGAQELFLKLDNQLQMGNYVVQVFAPEKTHAYNFQVK